MRVFEELRGLGYRGRLRCGPAICAQLAPGAGAPRRRGCLRAAELRPGRGVPVRLEPRGRADRRHDGDREGGACPAVPLPHDVRARLSARDPGDGVRRARPGVRLLPGRLHARHLRQHEDGGGARSWSARSAPTTVAFCRCAATTWSSRWPARRRRARRRDRSRTRSGWCASASSRRGCG